MRGTNWMLLGVTACGLSQRPFRPTPAQMAPPPSLSTHVTSTVGPLALEPGAGETPHGAVANARRIMEDHYLDQPRIEEETKLFVGFLDTFYRPLTRETRTGFEAVQQTVANLAKLAPYSVYSVTLAFQQSTQRLRLCVINARMMWPCVRERAPRPPRSETTPVFETGEAAPGIGLLAIHDLSDADDPAWRGFADAAHSLVAKRGLVIDLRDAAGADPRALLPWVATLTGRTSITPLRAIERPANAGPYVDAYRARFTDRGRDPAIWSALLGGESRPVGPATTQPIAIVVGPHCDSACELVARLLETYAGAVVIGGVTRAGRLARDEPALLTLPHSQTSVYFHATRYLLAADIEAATGPTEEWSALGGDFPDVIGDPSITDYMTFAIRDVTQRIEHAGWPRCDSFPSSPLDAKLDGFSRLTSNGICAVGIDITIRTDVPASALRRYLSTCSSEVKIDGFSSGSFIVCAPPTKPTPALLSQIAASDLVKRVSVECIRSAAPVWPEGA